MNHTKNIVKRAMFFVDAFRQVILGLAVTIACSGHVHAQPNDRWKFVGQIGCSKVVVLDRQSKAGVEERVWSALRSICTSSHCNANFYGNTSTQRRKSCLRGSYRSTLFSFIQRTMAFNGIAHFVRSQTTVSRSRNKPRSI